MTAPQTERPRFYQGQYIGPEDLSAAVDHARWAQARHDLGAHVWGIGIGLELRAIVSLEGGFDVYVEPGYAVDGFGRPLVVASPLAVPVDLLSRLSIALPPGQTSARVPVWLRYAETKTSEPPYGFGGCEDDTAFARIGEGCEIVVGARTIAQQRDSVDLGGESRDPVEALRSIETDAPLLCDASVPFQTFPASDDRWWLVPLGYVRWQPGSPGQLLQMTEADRRESRRLRRYLGSVAEGVYGADGLIRLRARATMPPSGATSLEDACDDEWPRAQGSVDLTYDSTNQRVIPAELVWVEGHLRVAGDARLFGGELEFRDKDGGTQDAAMRIHRVEVTSFLDGSGNPVNGRDLEIRIGSSADEGRNRLVIGVNPDDGGVVGRVVVQNDGKVGIGTLDPPTPLRSPLTVRGVGGGEELLSFETPSGVRRWHVNQKASGANGLNVAETDVKDGRLFLAAGGKVGLSTTAPDAKLDIAELPITPGALWFRIGDGGDSGRMWVEYSDVLAPLLVLSDKDNPPRLRFQQLGNSGDERAPDFSSWIGHGRPNSPDLAVIGGRLGVGTSVPTETLDVRGNVKLGALGNFFAVGGVDNVRLVRGQVAGGDGARQAGTGFTSTKTSDGKYRVNFAIPFSDPPVVLASAVGRIEGDVVATVTDVQAGSFAVFTKDVAGVVGFENSDFTFIALGPRA